MTVPEQITAIAERWGVDPRLALEVARRESNFNQSAISPKGAVGIMQLMPATAAGLGVNPYNLVENIEGGVRYLAQFLQQYAGDLQRTLAAYNWGPGNLAAAIQKYGQQWIAYIPQETKNYLRDVLAGLGAGATQPPGAGPEDSAAPETETLNIALLGLAALLFLWVVLE